MPLPRTQKLWHAGSTKPIACSTWDKPRWATYDSPRYFAGGFVLPDLNRKSTSVLRGLRRFEGGRARFTQPATGADHKILGKALAETAQEPDRPCQVWRRGAGEVNALERDQPGPQDREHQDHEGGREERLPDDRDIKEKGAERGV